MERRLGRGLGALLGQPPAAEPQVGQRELPVDRIRPNPLQPRKMFDPVALAELADSVRRHGILQPVVVRAAADGYELISGERRWRAAQQIGLRSIPAVLRADVSDEQMLELALVENVQRQDLDAIERACGFKVMMETLRITQEDVAQKVGLQRATVTNHLRLLDLPMEAQDAVSRGLISMGHARALLGLAGKENLSRILGKVVREGLSVRQVEALVRSQNGAARTSPSPAKVLVPHQPWVIELQDRLREALGTKVIVHNGTGYRGQIVIEYFNRSDLDRLCESLAPRTSLD